MPADSFHIIFSLAVILTAALIGGRFAAFFRVPRVTGYLLAGLLVGPSFAELLNLPALVSHPDLDELRLISDIALALILMNIGGQLRTENLRRWKQRLLIFSLTETLSTGLLVGASVFVVNYFIVQQTVTGLSLIQTSFFFAVFTGTISIATAPAATLMVIREYEAEGPITRLVLTLVSLNNLFSVFAFSIAAQLLVTPNGGIISIIYQLCIPLILGGSVGFVMSLWAQRMELPSEYKILLLGGVTVVAVISRYLGIEPLLSCMALGMILADSSPRWNRLLKALNEVDYPLYVVFFVLAGANLHIETLARIGLLGVAYVLARTIAKLASASLGAHLGGFGQREQRWVGMTLLAQAGMAIGLAATLAKQWPEGGKLVETVILGSVVVFELVGPLAVRCGLVRAGEVPLLSLLRKRAPQGGMEGMHSVANHFRNNLGLPAGHNLDNPGDILVRHVMRLNVETIHHGTKFQELLNIIAHSRYDRFPVVDDEQNFIGIINYTEIRNLLFDQSLSSLLVARDLVSSAHHSIPPDTPLRIALKTFQKKRNISYFPVIDPDEPQKLLGILSQNDVLAAFRRIDLEE
ncbi:transporter, CPA2 family [Desulfuromusa kysingii]|uniref:Transporter, CPA2 family n=1 Tax=Desulfuromusa kysingii TaxID=37625 RepID=A0A1H4DD56_9BACT|nr:cation:proton antiporter [Desulfuromusa kysingii]SEA70773.1 transporter, CPA2 family [Desulfuromusa kysingii]